MDTQNDTGTALNNSVNDRPLNPEPFRLICHEYDDAGRAIKVTDANGQATQTVYDANGQVERAIDAYGGQTLYFYNARGQQYRTVYPDGTETRGVFDAMGRVIWSTDWYATTGSGIDNTTSAPVATHTIYDSLGRVIETQRYKDVLIKIVDDGATSVKR